MPRKRHLESRALKSDEKVPNMDPQNLNYLNMAAEGLQKSIIPPTSQKSPKSHQNSSQRSSKWSPGDQKTLRGPLKKRTPKREGKRDQTHPRK